jgi:hypothetical protein
MNPKKTTGASRMIYIRTEDWDYAKKIGNGSTSAGIALALQAYRKQTADQSSIALE